MMHITPKPSRYLLAYQLSILMGAIACLWFTALPLLFKCGINLFIIFYWLHQFYFKNKIVKLRMSLEGEWQLLQNNDKTFTALLKANSFVTPWLIILNFKLENQRFGKSILFFPDSLDATTFRRLRFFLRTMG